MGEARAGQISTLPFGIRPARADRPVAITAAAIMESHRR
jgi:hypothetical protein